MRCNCNRPIVGGAGNNGNAGCRPRQTCGQSIEELKKTLADVEGTYEELGEDIDQLRKAVRECERNCCGCGHGGGCGCCGCCR